MIAEGPILGLVACPVDGYDPLICTPRVRMAAGQSHDIRHPAPRLVRRKHANIVLSQDPDMRVIDRYEWPGLIHVNRVEQSPSSWPRAIPHAD